MLVGYKQLHVIRNRSYVISNISCDFKTHDAINHVCYESVLFKTFGQV